MNVFYAESNFYERYPHFKIDALYGRLTSGPFYSEVQKPYSDTKLTEWLLTAFVDL